MSTATETAGAVAAPTLAVWKFASCDGCRPALLDCRDELLAVAGRVRIDSVPEAAGGVAPGPYDLSLVEGSITTPEDAARIRDVRARSRYLVVLGACGSSDGIQALRNYADVADVADGAFQGRVGAAYPSPLYLSTLKYSAPVRDHVKVDYELRGCPVDRGQLLEVITAFLSGRSPAIPDRSVCHECEARGAACVTVTYGAPCLGPVTQAGCGAICPAFHRGCVGCVGSARQARTEAMALLLLAEGCAPDRLLRTLMPANPANPANPADPGHRAPGLAVARTAADEAAGREREEGRREP
ncbi:hypothetical protein KGA66_00595 [Actinocrinis puniceicyclus]|uniref:NADH:ubiquinone oxidoreductase-like 20kDa subunit domain-containing protein n=1 Tax=Actinocrinis puniceicyclus TaxID=977794 RepID=A0A8J8B9Y7_9ACTN|nr:hypothetical protein [Actinocrinis puniceicyclus]MBS2961523.1 hypothetical protein [Actinocrinis puniceicyclus]